MKVIIKSSLLVVLLLQFAPVGVSVADTDTPAARSAAAQRYLRTFSIKDLLFDLASNMSRDLPVNERAEFIDSMVSKVNYDKISQIMLQALVKHFTADEINAWAAFMESKEGKSVMKKMGAYSADTMPAISKVMREAMLAGSR